METGCKVLDVMTNKPVTVSPDASVMDAATTMKEKGVGSLLVMQGSELAGIMTEKDIVVKVVSENKDPSITKVKSIMTAKEHIVSITPEKDVYEAMVIMRENEIRRLPVIQGNALKGLITQKDILKIEPALFELLVETIRIREEDRKLAFLDESIDSEDEKLFK